MYFFGCVLSILTDKNEASESEHCYNTVNTMNCKSEDMLTTNNNRGFADRGM